MSAAARWREYLEAWALPPALLAAVPDSPYAWPADFYRRRQRAESGGPPSPAARVALSLLPPGGALLDVGAGTGRASLPVAARVAVVLEAGERHPWADLIPYYRALHGLDRPEGPSADLLAEVVTEVVGVAPEVERWIGPAGMRFADLQELVEFYRRRLLAPASRAAEVADLLAADVVERDGWLSLGGEHVAVTVWWRV